MPIGVRFERNDKVAFKLTKYVCVVILIRYILENGMSRMIQNHSN